MDIDLHIEDLILHGFAPADRYRIAAAVEAELARMLTEHGVPPGLPGGMEAGRIDGGAFEVAPGAAAETIGAQVARAVYGGMSR